MARPFSYPSVAMLEVGQLADLCGPLSAVKRKLAPYAARHNKRFSISEDPVLGVSVTVTRLPVTDSELPGVA